EPTQSRPSRPLPSAGSTRRAGPHQHTHPASAPAGLPWRPASTLPTGPAAFGPDAQDLAVLAGLTPGNRLARAYPGVLGLVGCAGPHTDEVTSTQDLTRRFSTTPTAETMQALFEETCPAAARRWTGGNDDRYVAGYLWWFEDGVPGRAVRRFLCTVSLAG